MTRRYLTFDCYGTIVDWKTGIQDALRMLMGAGPPGRDLLGAYIEAEKSEEAEYKRYREVLESSARRLAKGWSLELGPREAAEFAESVPNWPAFPDSRKALTELGKLGYRRFILSNVDTDLLEETIRRNGLEVDGFLTAEEVGSYKPRKAHWTKFMERTGARRDEILHVAQSVYHDVIPAQELGIATAWVNRYGDRLPIDAKPSYIVDSLESLVKVLRSEPGPISNASS